MLNLLKMDLYRLFHSFSTWIMCLVTIGMAVFVVSMTKLEVSDIQSGGTETQIETGTKITDTEVQINLGISAYFSTEWATGEVPFTEIFSTQVATGLFLVVLSIFVALYVCAEHKNGYIKNIAGQFPNRSLLVISKVIAVGVQVLLMFLVLTVAMYVTGKVCYGSRFVFGSFGEFLKMFFGQYVLHYTFAAVILFLGVVSHSSALSMTIGILISCKFLSIVYALVERFWTDVTKYALEVNVIRFFTITEKKEMATVMVSALVLFGAVTTAAAVVMQKKDVR